MAFRAWIGYQLLLCIHLNSKKLKKKLSFALLLCFLYHVSVSQLAIGPFVSTNNLPVVPLNVLGGGVTAEVSENYNFSLSYFGKNFSPDSASYATPDGGIGRIHYQEKYQILHLSAAFSVYALGGRSSEKKFSAYVGGGLAGIYRMQQIHYLDAAAPADDKQNKFIFGFEFLAGIDYKPGPIKFFLQGKANILLNHVIPGSYDTALPLLTNTQLGILIPLAKD